MSTGRGVNCPTKKLEIIGFSKIDTLLIRLAVWIFRKRNLTISITRKVDRINPTSKLYVDGSIGTGI